MTLTEFVSEPKLVEAYKKWLNDPMTKIVFGISEHLSKPTFFGIGDISIDKAALAHAEHAGYWKCLMFQQDLTGIAPEVAQEVEETYGADEILKSLHLPQKQKQTKRGRRSNASEE